jgi:hypothetical protein
VLFHARELVIDVGARGVRVATRVVRLGGLLLAWVGASVELSLGSGVCAAACCAVSVAGCADAATGAAAVGRTVTVTPATQTPLQRA